MQRLALGRLLRFAVRDCRVRAAGQSLMRLMRFSHMRLMADHSFVSANVQPE